MSSHYNLDLPRCDGCGATNKTTIPHVLYLGHTYANQDYCSSCCKTSIAAGELNDAWRNLICPKCQEYVNDGDVCCGEVSNV